MHKHGPLLLLAVTLSVAQAALAQGKPGLEPSLKISYTLNGQSPFRHDGRPQDLWERIRAGFRLREVNPELTRRHEQWYVQRSAALLRTIERSRPYLFHIADEVERRGMPMEIALLPLIESAFDPMAESRRQAAGIWQFIPSTGRVLGLTQNAWYDGRRDVLDATRAALDYLELLQRQFGSWELALAAYNCGEGCLTRAIARNRAKGKSTAYAALPLPTETHHYVPKLLAVRNLLRAPQAYGLALESVANEPYFVQVRLDQPMPLRQAARLAEMSLEEFLALNPAFRRRVIHTDTRGVLLLPADRVDAFHTNLRHSQPSGLHLYRGRRGESLSGIAQRFGVSVNWLKEHNPLQLIGGRLAADQMLYVPAEPRGGAARLVQGGAQADGKTSQGET